MSAIEYLCLIEACVTFKHPRAFKGLISTNFFGRSDCDVDFGENINQTTRLVTK